MAASILPHVSQELGPKAHSESSGNAGLSGGQVATGLEQSSGLLRGPVGAESYPGEDPPEGSSSGK